MSDDDAPIYLEVTNDNGDPLKDYRPSDLAILADQIYTITALLEEIAVNQTELDAKLAPVLDAVKRLEEREAAEVATPALDTASLDSLAGRLDALDAAQAARVPVPVVPVVDPTAPAV